MDITIVLFVTLVLLLEISTAVADSSGLCPRSSTVHKKTFRSPAFSLLPGEVQDRYYSMEFPKGNLGIRDFRGEVVDELGNPVPLSEVYLHHWVVFQVHVKSDESKDFSDFRSRTNGSVLIAGNDGICQKHVLPQYWGLGSETRHTTYAVPAPYAIHVGDPKDIPPGYEERWVLNVHAIDTRGTPDPQGCLECRCNLYNVTKDASEKPLPEGYVGGLRCCYEGTRCSVKDGYEGQSRTLYLQYTVEWVEWDECVIPVRAYILDIMDTHERDHSNSQIGCKVEYDVPSCEPSCNGDCTHVMKNTLVIPKGGNIIYGVAHQHAGAKGMTMHGEDGRHLCSSIPSYGSGDTAGDEAGYVVGMSSCYPKLGTAKFASGEKLHLTSYYSSVKDHTGVMALFYLIVADEDETSSIDSLKALEGDALNMNVVVAVAVVAVLSAVSGIFYYLHKIRESQGYEVLLPTA